MVIPLHALCQDRSTECRTYAPCKLANNQRIKLQQDYCCIEIVICKFSYIFLLFLYLFLIYFLFLFFISFAENIQTVTWRIYSVISLK